MNEQALLLYAERTYTDCLTESGGDEDAALLATEIILGTQPMPDDFSLSTDAEGHQHKGTGEGGGQFTGTGVGTSSNKRHIKETPTKFPNFDRRYEFTTNSGKYKVHVLRYAKDDPRWQIHFDTRIGGSKVTHVTGHAGGGAVAVIRGVVDAAEKFIEDVDPKQLNIPGKKDNESRVSLYRKLAQKIAKKYGYNLNERDNGVEIVQELWKGEHTATLSIDAFFTHDIANRRAQGVLNRAMQSAKAMTAAAKKDLATALKNGARDSGEAILKFIDKYRLQLAKLLTATQLASLLEGAREVAADVPTLATFPGAVAPPPTLEPRDAVELVERLSKLTDTARAEAIYALSADQQVYVQQALAAMEAGGLPPKFSPPAPPAGSPEEIHFPTIDEAVKQLAEKNVMTRERFDALDAAAKQKSFAVAGVIADETLTKVRDVLAENVKAGADYETFKQAVLEAVDEGTFMSEWHLETVFRTNVQSAFSDGQMKALSNPMVRSGFPYTAYDSIHDDRVRPEHKELDHLGIQGTNIYRTDDPVFRTFRPPWDFNCRCSWTPMTVRQAAEAGINEAEKWLADGVEPSPPAFVPMPDFAPPPGFRRTVSSAPLSVQLSLQSLGVFAQDAEGHEHKGKGAGGGQFTGTGDGVGSSSKPDKKTIEHLTKQAHSLSDEEKNVVKFYSEGGYYGINNVLRGVAGSPMNEEKKRNIELLDAVMSKTSLPEPTTAYRGVFNKTMKSWKVGSVIEDEGYMSTTLDSNLLTSFNKKRMTELIINVPKGHQGIYVDALVSKERSDTAKTQGGGPGTESELLLPRKTKLRVTKVNTETRDGKERTRIEVEIVPSQSLSIEDTQLVVSFSTDAEGYQHKGEGAGGGQFTGTGGGSAKPNSSAGKAVSAVKQANKWLHDKGHAGFAKLPGPVQTAISTVVSVAFAGWTASQKIAERISIEKGSTPEQAAQTRSILAAADLMAFKPMAIATAPLGAAVAAATWVVPPVTACYLAHSAVAHPLATYRAARGIIGDILKAARDKQAKHTQVLST